MSIKAMVWAWEREALPSGVLLVLLALADHADDEGVCWPGTQGLAKKCSLNPSSIWRHTQVLLKADLLETFDHALAGGKVVRGYRLLLHGRNTLQGASDPLQGARPILQGAKNIIGKNHQESINEPSDIHARQQPLDSNTWPDWYSDLYAIKGFKKSMDECRKWMKREGISEGMANETAAAVKGKWPGPKSKPYTDAWAVFRSWVKRPKLSGNGRPVRPSGDHTVDELKAGWGNGQSG